jgi:hypothetical protein
VSGQLLAPAALKRRESARFPLKETLGGLINQSGHFEEKKKFLLPAIKA